MSTPATRLAFLPTSFCAAVKRRDGTTGGGMAAAVLAVVLLGSAGLGEAAASTVESAAQAAYPPRSAGTVAAEAEDDAAPREADGAPGSAGLSALADVSARVEARMARWASANLGQMPDMAGYGLLLAGLGVMDALARKRRQHGG